VRSPLTTAWRTVRATVSKRRPYYCNLVITRRCNLQCDFCQVWEFGSRDELSTDQVFRCIERADQMGVARFNITGGEPMLRTDIFDVLNHAAGLFSVGLNSNGTVSRKLYERLLETNVGDIGISLHYRTPEKQDRLAHQAGSFRKIVDNICFLRDNAGGRLIYVNAVIHADNVDEILPLKRFCNEELGVVMRVIPVAVAFREHDLQSLLKKHDPALHAFNGSLDALYAELSKNAGAEVCRSPIYLEKSFAQAKGEKVWECLAGNLYFSISPKGRFSICQDYDTELDFLDPEFFAKWEQAEFQAQMRRTRTACSGCTYSCYMETQFLLERPWQALMLARAKKQAVAALGGRGRATPRPTE
jgi:MoaA/NifB/PqqE/SkfB family radical SAM enzyme